MFLYIYYSIIYFVVLNYVNFNSKQQDQRSCSIISTETNCIFCLLQIYLDVLTKIQLDRKISKRWFYRKYLNINFYQTWGIFEYNIKMSRIASKINLWYYNIIVVRILKSKVIILIRIMSTIWTCSRVPKINLQVIIIIIIINQSILARLFY